MLGWIHIVALSFVATLVAAPLSAAPISVSLEQLVQTSFGVQSDLQGSFRQLAPDPTTYIHNIDFKFFGIDAAIPPFLGRASGLVDSLVLDGKEGCVASDFAGFSRGSIALMIERNCLYSTMINNAAAAGAIGALVVPNSVPVETTYFGLVAAVPIPAIIVSRSVANSLNSKLLEVPAPSLAPLFLLGSTASVYRGARRRRP